MKRVNILELKMVSVDPALSELRDRFFNHALSGTPPDQCDIRVGWPLQNGRRQFSQQSIYLSHPLLLRLPPHRRRSEHIADQYALLVVIIGCGDVKSPLSARER